MQHLHDAVLNAFLTGEKKPDPSSKLDCFLSHISLFTDLLSNIFPCFKTSATDTKLKNAGLRDSAKCIVCVSAHLKCKHDSSNCLLHQLTKRMITESSSQTLPSALSCFNYLSMSPVTRVPFCFGLVQSHVSIERVGLTAIHFANREGGSIQVNRSVRSILKTK